MSLKTWQQKLLSRMKQKKNRSLQLPLCFSVLSDTLFWKLQLPWSPQILSLTSSAQGVLQTPPYLTPFYQNLETLSKQETGAILVIALFVSRLSEGAAFHWLMSSVLKTIFSCNSSSFLVVSGDRVNPVAIITLWSESETNSTAF